MIICNKAVGNILDSVILVHTLIYNSYSHKIVLYLDRKSLKLE